MRNRRAMTGLLCMLLAAGAVPARADEAADGCGAAKLKGTSRYGSKVILCRATAYRTGSALDPACVSKAFTKLTPAFSRAESAGGCATGGDVGPVASDVDDDGAELAAAIAAGSTDDSRRCAVSKLKAAGKQYAALLACYAKAARSDAGPDPDCLDAADGKLAAAFAKADGKGGCVATGDAASVSGLVHGGVRDRVASLSPVCGDAISGPTQDCEPEDDAACPGYCTGSCTCIFPPDCGNGVAERPEECDDGNHADGDGCSSSCLLEDASARCTGVASTSGTAIDAVLVASGLDLPTYATSPPLDTNRLFVVERTGRIRIVRLLDDSLASTPFLDIHGLVSVGGEQGLLSMAFDPAYDANRRFYVDYTDTDGNTVVERFEASVDNPNVADPASGRVLITIDQPYANHNGGQLQFGPDGYLYVGMGDGGGGGDPDENGQNDAALLGKMLRIDADVSNAPYRAVPASNPHYAGGSSDLELIWAKGLRNPWRFSFDLATGDLVIGDVGQGAIEEIDFQPASSTGGENYGWDVFEGDQCFEPDPAPVCPSPPTGFTMPIYEYTHDDGSCAIMGGYVYRGCAMPDLAGQYFFSDYCTSFLATVKIVGGAATAFQDRTADAESAGATFSNVVSFGEDARGELYMMQETGDLYRIEPE